MPENTIITRVKNAWNAFMNRDPPVNVYSSYGGSSYNPYRTRLSRGNERSLIAPIFTKIAMDCASIQLQHVRLDSDGNYIETINSKLNGCLTVNANKDQTARQFIQDAIVSMFDEGVIALPPIDTVTRLTKDGVETDIESIRTAKILEWMPDYIRLRAYNDVTGSPGDLVLPKAAVPILENPLYAVMNEPNSVVQRLVRTLNLSDTIDAKTGSGKLDMLIQLPYPVRSEGMRAKAEARRKDIEDQLQNSRYGVAYLDGNEHVTQLNRAVENNLYDRVKYLMEQLYDQLGITAAIMNGSASEAEMQNYYSRTIEPVISVVVDNMKWKYLTKKARDNGETIMIFRDPFKLVPIAQMAEIADKFTRNEILTPNEVRQIVGRKPVDDEKANELRNRNISAAEGQEFANTKEISEPSSKDSDTDKQDSEEKE